MIHLRRLFGLASLTALTLACACGGSTSPGTHADTTADTGPGDTLTLDTAASPDAVDPSAHVVIVHTSDEQGWIAGRTSAAGVTIGGAALVMGAWETLEPAERLTLSSGSSFVGAAISTWFDGEPAVAMMNAMGYDAMALGNHEFDLGRAQLATWRDALTFPILAANVTDDGSGLAAFDAPWVILPVDGVAVGVIGLATPKTPTLAPPQHLGGLTFEAMAPALETAVAEVRDAGADVVVALAHAPASDLGALALATDVDVVLGGQTSAVSSGMVNGALLVESGAAWVGYTRIALTVDRATGQITGGGAAWRLLDAGFAPRVTPDPDCVAIVASWQDAVNAALGDRIGFLAVSVAAASWAQANWVTDAWRWRFPEADIALQNSGGLRMSFAAGDITRGDVVDVLPFDNFIYEVSLTGAEVAAQLALGLDYCGTTCFVAVSGIRYHAGAEGLDVVLADGSALDPEATYTVLVTDFMYFGGAGFSFAALGHEPWETGLNYRDPPMAWTEAQGTTAEAPLDGLLDPTPRNAIE